MWPNTLFSLVLLVVSVTASIIPVERLRPRHEQDGAPTGDGIESRQSTCTNTPTTRNCWSNGYNISTNYDLGWPSTGNTVSYTFTITNVTLSPDGIKRQGFAINGQFPGPTIYANWGDNIQVTVVNQMQNNGTSIHWHGMRMLNKNTQDGVPGVTECPIAPGGSKTYTFQATQHGTSWYHSHFSSQYGDGIWGPIVIYGPATANYDQELGPLPISDWYYAGTFVASARASHTNAPPPTADNGLLNGTMISKSGTGAYARTVLTAGQKHRLRLMNTAVDNHFMFSLDNHTMTVIAADFVPIVPYNASWVFIGIGQRYDVIINANQPPGSYWFRAETPLSACGSNYQNGNIKSIFAYKGFETTTPTSTAVTYTKRCTDETQIVSYWNSYVPKNQIPAVFDQLDTAVNMSTNANGTLNVYWQVNGTPLKVNWSMPTLSQVQAGSTNYGSQANIVQLPNETSWTYWVVTEGTGSPTVNIPHPIHVHGHDFYVLGTGTSKWNATTNAKTLNYNNPPRRDVAMLPSGGWLALALYTDNPGAWLMHCHIAWHADEGFAVQLLESNSTMLQASPLPSDYNSQCAAWNSYFPAKSYYQQTDSGI